MGATKNNDYQLEELKISLLCRAAAHPARVKILDQLVAHPEGCRNMDLAKCLSFSRPTIKNHIDMMKDAGIIEVEYLPHFYRIYLNERGVNFVKLILSEAN
ncbi:MAG: winged helix-turn-helix domain-containing protein [Bacteroidota bacterium]